ncbi:cilia- and flagella-associated protein 45-like isoform X2 [Venturia canescens]|uniref:cilia- and flagella-associated protein 45-like isoform X2 n=1 Tax=Venturia canescens TaxID=32260 RepID=UPI001C9BF796|nr:cilia- and flagella-associated protein 45-like isoform X2 [Venturia canescens]
MSRSPSSARYRKSGISVVNESKDANGRPRKYIIPSKEPNIYPKILSKKEYNYFRECSKAGLVTKEEREAAQMAIEKEKDRLVAESMARKEAIRKIDMQRTKEKASRLDDVEAEARRRTMHLLERAYNLKLEQEEEIQKCNRLILETKCRAIRDAQIAEKKLIERELNEEEERLNAMMENERRIALKEDEKKEQREAAKKRQFARLLKNQIEENEEQRIMELERKQEEGRLIMLNNIAWQENEIAKMQKKDAENALIRKELASGNERLRHFKEMEQEENRIMDLRIREFQKLKEEREAEIAEAQRLAKLRKEREKERVAAQTRQAQDVQAQIDEINAARVHEEVEREWRRKEKEEAVKRAEKLKKIEMDRKEQIYGRKMIQAMEMERDRREFEKILNVQREAICRDEKLREIKEREARRYRSEILRQVNEKEREKIEERRKTFEEGLAMRMEVEMRKKKLREAMERKCDEMRANKVPETYINEVKDMIQNVS